MFCVSCGKENDERSQFCMHCGAELHVPGNATNSMKESLTTQGGINKPANDAKGRRRLMLWLGIGGAFLVFVACVAIVFGVLGYNLFAPKEQLFYIIQDETADNYATAVMTIRADGKENKELYSDRDGFYMLWSLPGVQNNFISPDGQTLALLDSQEELLLINNTGTAPVPLDTGIEIPFFQGFSPDGKYFGYTTIDDDRPSVRVVNLQGSEVLAIDDVIFSAFLPNSKQAVVIEYDTDDYRITAMAIVDVPSGEYTHLDDIEVVTDFPLVFVSSDGKTIYYTDNTGLMAFSVTGGSASSVYESELIDWAFFSPDGRMIAILDDKKDALYLYDTKRKSTTRIDKDVFLDIDFDLTFNSPVSFSSDSKYLAYIVGPGDLELYVVKVDGSDRVRLAENAQAFRFAFSPDKQHIAYIKWDNTYEGGDLYITRLDGSESKRLETGIWSFRFIEEGKYIVYTKVEDLDRGAPESEIYRIKIDGQDKKLILPADDGLFTFIWPVP